MSPDRERASAGDSNSAVQRRRKRIWIDLTISEFGCFQPTQIQTRPLRLFEFNLVNIIDFHKDCHKDKKTASIACSKLIRHAIGKTAFLQRHGVSDKIERLSVRRDDSEPSILGGCITWSRGDFSFSSERAKPLKQRTFRKQFLATLFSRFSRQIWFNWIPSESIIRSET